MCVVGLGYIGLPTAVVLATHGVPVVGVEIRSDVVARVNAGELPFEEPDLAHELRRAVDSGALSASTDVPEAETYIIAVPTPQLPDHSADLTAVESAARAVAAYLQPGNLVVLESTVSPGTTERMAELIVRERPDLSLEEGAPNQVLVAHCPERVLPGRIMTELIHNDRVIGGLTSSAAQRAASVYGTFCQGELLLTTAAAAELTKLAENSYRDVNIAFANELAIIAEKFGINPWEVIALANRHPRVNILRPGPGVGGHCIAIDPWFIVAAAPEEARLIRTAREVNDSKPDYVLAQVGQALEGSISPRIAALGLAFKADVDDLRESPAVEIVERLAAQYPTGQIAVVEPHVTELPDRLMEAQNVQLTDLSSAMRGVNLVLLLVNHSEFADARALVPDDAAVIDTRGMWG